MYAWIIKPMDVKLTQLPNLQCFEAFAIHLERSQGAVLTLLIECVRLELQVQATHPK